MIYHTFEEGGIYDIIGYMIRLKYDKDNKVREVKLIFNPEEYRKGKKARPLHTQNGLIKILEKNKELCI